MTMKATLMTIRKAGPVQFSTLVANYESTTSVADTGNVTLSAAVPLGALLLVSYTSTTNGTSAAPTISDSKGHTWQSATAAYSFGGRTTIWWTVTTVALTTSDWIKATHPSSNRACKVSARYATGFNSTTPVPDSATNSSASSSTVAWMDPRPDPVAGDGVFFAVGYAAPASWSGGGTIPTGFTNELEASNSVGNFTSLTGYRAYTSAAVDEPDGGVVTGPYTGHYTAVAIRIATA